MMSGSEIKKVAIVTGANTGLGFETSKLLAGQGYHVILACRSEEKAAAAIQELKSSCPEANLSFMELDLSSCKSIRSFASAFKESGKNLIILINNAGMFLAFGEKNWTPTKDGFEQTMGTNHLGHFLLTTLLLDNLKSTAESEGEARVVVLASMLHERAMCDKMSKQYSNPPCQAIDMEDLNMEKPGIFNGLQSYSNSKTANIMFTYELARRLKDFNITVNCLCPGFIPSTNLARHGSAFSRFFMRYILDGLFRFFGKTITRTIDEGSGDIFWLATSPEAKEFSGKFFCNGVHEPATSKDETNDPEMQAKLWEVSERLVSDKGL